MKKRLKFSPGKLLRACFTARNYVQNEEKKVKKKKKKKEKKKSKKRKEK